MQRRSTLGIAALGIYIIGGIGAFGGILIKLLANGRTLWGWQDGGTLGSTLLAAGVVCSLAGVLFMRIYRNRC